MNYLCSSSRRRGIGFNGRRLLEVHLFQKPLADPLSRLSADAGSSLMRDGTVLTIHSIREVVR